MRQILKALYLTLLLSSCATRLQESQSSHHDDGSAKPKVAILPVIDHSHSPMDLDLSKEFSDALIKSLSKADCFFVSDEFDILASACFTKPEQNQNPFFEDLSWINEMNTSTEFLVLIELLSHKLIPKSATGKLFNLMQAYTLDMSIRIKVIDIRDKRSQVILQEIIHRSFHIPWKISTPDQHSAWSMAAFSLSPIGMAHTEMVKRISTQIQDYILLAKKNK